MKINTDNQNFINTLLILSGTTSAGTAVGYGCYKAKEKGYKNIIQAELAQLEKENEIEFRNLNQRCFETVKNNKNYKNQIDVFAKEGKILGRDYQLKDILNEVDLKDYKRLVEQLTNFIKKQNAEIITEMNKQIIKNKQICIVTGAFSGLIGGIGIKFLKQHMDTKNACKSKLSATSEV